MKVLHRTLFTVSILILSLFAATTFFRAISGMLTPYLHNYGENTILVNAWGLATGHGLYRLSELKQVPVFAATYPPVLYLLVAAGIKIWGISYTPGRLLVYIALFGSAAMIVGIARRRGCDVRVAVMAGFAFLGVFPVYRWSPYLRVDFPALFFELAAVYIYLGPGAPVKRAGGFVIMGLLAGYTKQSIFCLAVAALLGAVIEGSPEEKKRAVIIGCAYALSAAAVFGLLEALTDGSFHEFVIGSFNKEIEWGYLNREHTCWSAIR